MLKMQAPGDARRSSTSRAASAATRGTVETRAKETAKASGLLGLVGRENLGLPDTRRRGHRGGDRRSSSRRSAAGGRSSSSGRAPRTSTPTTSPRAALVARAYYLATIGKADGGGLPPHRPDALIHYYGHLEPTPSFVVDVSDVWERRVEVTACYASQLGLDGAKGPATNITSPDFRRRYEARFAYWGARIGAAYGEPFFARRVVPLDDPVDALRKRGGGRERQSGTAREDRRRLLPDVRRLGRVATELALGLAERGHEVHLLSYAAPARLEGFDERVHFHEVEVTSYPLFRYPPYEVALASRLAEVAEEEGLDLVHAHYAIPHTLAALLVKDVVRPRAFPVVTTLHGTDITVVGQDRSYARVTRYAHRALRRGDGRLGVPARTGPSRSSASSADRRHPELRRPRALPAAPEPGRAPPAFARGGRGPRPRQQLPPGQARGAVVEAFAKVAAAMPGVLLMVGDGPDRAACEARRARARRARPRAVPRRAGGRRGPAAARPTCSCCRASTSRSGSRRSRRWRAASSPSPPRRAASPR